MSLLLFYTVWSYYKDRSYRLVFFFYLVNENSINHKRATNRRLYNKISHYIIKVSLAKLSGEIQQGNNAGLIKLKTKLQTKERLNALSVSELEDLECH